MPKSGTGTIPLQPKSGFTLLEVVISLAILMMLFVAISKIVQSILENVIQSRIRTVALSLAQSQLEQIHNLPYVKVGTVGGIPPGSIQPQKTVIVNSQKYTIETSIVFIDDPFDQQTPQDLVNVDYKRVRVQVTWEDDIESAPVTLLTNISPKGIETWQNSGTLVINVFNSQGLPVSGATVNIDNEILTPQIHTQTYTDNFGLVVYPGTPICNTCYKVTVTKAGYSTDKTYSTTEVTNPLQPYATVLNGQITSMSFAIDQVGAVTLQSYNPSYNPTTNIQFTLRGQKIIGYDINDDPVYKTSINSNTGGFTVQIPGLEWDTYELILTNFFHNLAGSNPIFPIALSPGSSLTVPFIAGPYSQSSLLLIVKDAQDQPLASASANLKNMGLSYDLTKVTNATGSVDFGQVFFSNLSPAVYNYQISLPGYKEATGSVNISSNMREMFILEKL